MQNEKEEGVALLKRSIDITVHAQRVIVAESMTERK